MARKVPEFHHSSLESYQSHQKSLKMLKLLLEKNQIEYRLFERSDRQIQTRDEFDLWISLGGDGTFLYSSHQNTRAPLLGINSSPRTSVGNFCRFNMFDHSKQIITLLRGAKDQRIKPRRLERLQLVLDNIKIPTPVLNDVLVADKNPAVISAYVIAYKKKREAQKSSGIWITSPSGSTAAYRSSGGRSFPRHGLGKQNYGFMVRELHKKTKTSLVNEIVYEDEFFEIISAMKNGALYLDGRRKFLRFHTGSQLKINFHPKPLLSF